MTHPMDYYGRIVELEAKLKKVETANKKLRQVLRRCSVALLALKDGSLEDETNLVWKQACREARQTNRCMACDTLLEHRPRARKRLICADKECLRTYQELYYFMVTKPRRARGPR